MIRHLKFYRSPNEGGGGAPQAGAGGGAQDDPVSSGGAGGGAEDVSSLPEWAQKALRATREEAAKYRVTAKENAQAAAKLKEFEDKNLSEIEKAKRDAAAAQDAMNQLQSELRRERLTRTVEAEARKLNIIDPEAAFLLVQSRVEYDESGNASNLQALLTDLAKQKPYLTQSHASPMSSPTNAASGVGRGGSLEAYEKMTPQQIAALPPEEYAKLTEMLRR